MQTCVIKYGISVIFGLMSCKSIYPRCCKQSLHCKKARSYDWDNGGMTYKPLARWLFSAWRNVHYIQRQMLIWNSNLWHSIFIFLKREREIYKLKSFLLFFTKAWTVDFFFWFVCSSITVPYMPSNYYLAPNEIILLVSSYYLSYLIDTFP